MHDAFNVLHVLVVVVVYCRPQVEKLVAHTTLLHLFVSSADLATSLIPSPVHLLISSL